MRGCRQQCESNTYHVISRGVGRHIIFEDRKDRERYLDQLRGYAHSENVTVLAWCLMDNHTHLLLRANIDDIANMMRKINSSYALYYNRRHDHVGHLFQGRFKSEPVVCDEHLLTVLRYIHANPQKAGISPINLYPWSSYAEYIQKANGAVCDTSIVMDLLGSVEEFERLHLQEVNPLVCMSSDETPRTLSPDRVREIAASVIGEKELAELATLPKTERNRLIVELREAGISIRKIERLTGVGRKIIANAKR